MAIFQKTMDSILQGFEGIICYSDDLLITGKTVEEHFPNLDKVLQRLQEYGIHLYKEKFQFLMIYVKYLGHKIDKEDLYALESKLQAITEAPAPRNLTKLRFFLGLLNYYERFIPNVFSKIYPFHQLLQQDTR